MVYAADFAFALATLILVFIFLVMCCVLLLYSSPLFLHFIVAQIDTECVVCILEEGDAWN